MKKTNELLTEWLQSVEQYNTPRIDYLPNIDLYMDQVITFLEKSLGPLNQNANTTMITSSMINNYVKGNVIPNPIQKKYSRVHLAYIIALCSLKQVLPIADIAKILKVSDEESENFFLYDVFRNAQDEAIHRKSTEVLKIIENFNNEDNEDLKQLALKLAVEANASKMISERILYFLNAQEKAEIEELKKKTENKESKKEQDK